MTALQASRQVPEGVQLSNAFQREVAPIGSMEEPDVGLERQERRAAFAHFEMRPKLSVVLIRP